MRRAPIALLSLVAFACGSQEPEATTPSAGPSIATSAEPPPSASASSAPVATGPVVRSMPHGKADAPRVALGTHGAVSSQEGEASKVGLAILKKGGNAVDAAVGVAFALAVTHPSAGNIGGGGFMVIRMHDGTKAAIDYRETAPAKASRDMYLDKKGNSTKDSLNGAKAAGIPGTVSGLALAHQKFGKLPWKDVIQPAIDLAEKGFALDQATAKDYASNAKKMHDLKFEAGAKAITRADGKPFETGDTYQAPALGKTLEMIRDQGPRSFYEGAFAEKVTAEVQKAGGIWLASDLAGYQAKLRDPIVFEYKGEEVITMPPPSAGGVVLRQLLDASEVMHLDQKPWRSADEIHLFAEAMRRVYADRNQLLADPDFAKIPMQQLLDPAYIAGRVKDIDPDHATPSTTIKAGIEAPHESTQTTHFSVIDEDGDAVSNTFTLNTAFGCKVIVSEGFFLNNEMDDFATKPGSPNVFGLVQGELNKIEPGKRMLSSMTPTILVDHGEVRAVVGSPGGSTISTTVAQIIRGLVDYKRPLDEVIPMFRAHNQWLPDEILTEGGMPKDVEDGLVKKGHKIHRIERIGHANCIEVDPETHGFRAVSDTSRSGGEASAY